MKFSPTMKKSTHVYKTQRTNRSGKTRKNLTASTPAISYKLDFALRASGHVITAHYFRPILRRIMLFLQKEKHLKKKLQGGIIQLVIVEDEEIQLINTIYRRKNEPTDVVALSYFGKNDFPGKENMIGEIVISAETAKRQAKEHQKTFKEELQFLFVHGVLHIFGYDHEKTEDRKIMFDLQDTILETASWRKIIEPESSSTIEHQ